MFIGGRRARCRKVRHMFSEYLDDRLVREDRGAVERHIETCEACSNELESLRMTVQLLHRLPVVPAPRSFAIRAVETGRASIFDPQRLRWLRPATAFATVALVLLLLLDFLQVIPHEVGGGGDGVFTAAPTQTIVSPGMEGEEDTFEYKSVGPPEDIPVPAPPTTFAFEQGLARSDDFEVDEGKGYYDSEAGISDESGGGWPLRQIQIAIGVMVFALVAVMLFARRQRRKWSRV